MASRRLPRLARARSRAGVGRAPEKPAGPTLTLHVTEDKVDGGYVAEVVELPGCMSQGETFEEAVQNTLDAFHEVLVAEADSEIKSGHVKLGSKSQDVRLVVGAC